MVKRVKTKIKHFNDWLAVFLVKKVLTMWCAYLFAIYGILGIFFPDQINILTFWSNWPQLWLLPVIIVGQELLGKLTERLLNRMYDMIKEENNMVKEELSLLRQLVEKQNVINKQK